MLAINLISAQISILFYKWRSRTGINVAVR